MISKLKVRTPGGVDLCLYLCSLYLSGCLDLSRQSAYIHVYIHTYIYIGLTMISKLKVRTAVCLSLDSLYIHTCIYTYMYIHRLKGGGLILSLRG